MPAESMAALLDKMSGKVWAAPQAQVIDVPRIEQKIEYRYCDFFVAHIVALRVALTAGHARSERR
jgi:hypothetical protein